MIRFWYLLFFYWLILTPLKSFSQDPLSLNQDDLTILSLDEIQKKLQDLQKKDDEDSKQLTHLLGVNQRLCQKLQAIQGVIQLIR